MLRDKTFEPELASLTEKIRSYFALLEGIDGYPLGPPAQESGKIGLAYRERKTAQIVAVHCQYIEGAELDFLAMPAGMQGIEIGDAVNAQDDGLAIEHKPPGAVLQGGFDDPWIALRPVVTAARKQADSVTVPVNPEAVDPMQAQRAERCTS